MSLEKLAAEIKRLDDQARAKAVADGRPFYRCGHVGADGCCTHPGNGTPECHRDACPIRVLP